MKKLFFALCAAFVLFVVPAGATSPLTGKIIALDAGHGNGATGAIGYCDGASVAEADVNLKVRADLKVLLETNGATVFDVPQLASRKERVVAAEAAGAEALISIHHNGSSNTDADYTQSFVTQNNDKALAQPIHSALVEALGLPDKGIKHDGYGITVYGGIPGVLTESYFITNTAAACDFLGAQARVSDEAGALYDGLVTYFLQLSGGSDGEGGKPDKCSPWPSCKNL